jgi:CBS domain-containing protein
MIAKARDIMVTRFHTLRPEMTIVQAIRFFKTAGEEEGSKVFGMMVTNEKGELIGMLSMYDILLFIRPSKSRNWQGMDDLEIDDLLEETCANAKTTLVSDIMTSDVITVSVDTHVIKILDTMIRRYIRRLPVMDGKRIVGMLYLSNVFEYLCNKIVSR